MKNRKAVIKKAIGDKTNTLVYTNMFSFKEYERGVEIKPYNQESIVFTDMHAKLLLQVLMRRMKKKKFLEDI